MHLHRRLPLGPVILAFALIGLSLPAVLQAQTAEPIDVANLLQGRDIVYDDDGLIVHEHDPDKPADVEKFDGGDTAQREGWYWLGVWIRQHTPGMQPWTKPRRLTFDQVLQLLEPNRDGVFYRHPKLAPWNNPHGLEFGFSRDQMVPLVAAMGVWGKHAEIRRLWEALPEDVLGKHSFNGRWRFFNVLHPTAPENLLDIDGQNCTEIKNRGCDATRDCSLKTDTRDCSLKTDTRDCTLQVDTRNCEVCLISNPFGGCILYGNDPFCEAAKAAQNLIYKANKDACELAKATQNALYAGEKAACEAAKATQNGIYKAEKDACEVVKATEKAACEAQKTIDLNLCRLTSIHTGDFIGPATENLFSRALGESLWHPLGDAELLANTLLRIHKASDRDDVGDDLNLIAMLLMSKLQSPTPESEAAVAAYASLRPFSYGSYLGTYNSVYPMDLATYRATYGDDTQVMKDRITDGITNRGWRADAPAVNGAARWYHRVEGRGNPQLAELYEPIIDQFIYGDPTFSTTGAGNPPPTISGVAPSAGPSSGGTAITIRGGNFTSTTSVLIDGFEPLAVVVVNSTTITAITPVHSAGPVNVSVTVPWPGGGTAVMSSGFSYWAAAPGGNSGAPFGVIDTPLNHSPGVTGSIPVTGWALDDVKVTRVRVMRGAVKGETGSLIFVGNAVIVKGARPDVAAAYPTMPNNTAAGWGYLLLTNFLPNGGNGTFTLYAYADDANGHSTLLGTRTITCDNANATKPFGAIDTPDQGATVSGVVNNFGWVLSPGPRRADPGGGGSVSVYVDGVAIGSPGLWTSRSDLTTLFALSDYSGVRSALGVFNLDTTSLADGVHTIAWGITDSQGGRGRIGSRYFTVANGAVRAAATAAPALSSRFVVPNGTSVYGRRGFAPDAPLRIYRSNGNGLITVHAEELDRIELQLGATAGYLRGSTGLEPLPTGAGLAPVDGTFTWQPGVAFVGSYDFVFDRPGGTQYVRVMLHPKGSNRVGTQVVIDAPGPHQDVTTTFTIAGWAADLDADEGTGIDAIHVWAYPVAGGDAIFLGTAALGVQRQDVGDIHGERFTKAGYSLTVRDVARGTYDLAVFAWSTVQGGFAPARTVRVTVR